ncbi:MAG: UMP kinase, partial [Nanoarchaeota archaeon]
VCGGGYIARSYQESANIITKLDSENKDWLGIQATKINALLIKSVFKEELVHGEVIEDPTLKIETDKQIIICSGWKPGWSTDYVAVKMALNFKADKIINLSNIDYVYSADPKKNSKTIKYKKLNWKAYLSLIDNKWSPGMNSPFDPIASQLAEKEKLEVNIIGKDLENLKNLINGNNFEGTIIG